MAVNADFDESDLDTYSYIRERDVDIVLVMALQSSPAIRRRFAAIVDAGDAAAVVRHSLDNEDLRETDIVVRFELAGAVAVLEVENKIAAVFQSDQIEDYRKRVTAHHADSGVRAAASVLIAPDAYIAGAGMVIEGFDAAVSYEELRDLLADEGEWGRAGALVLEHAIRQHRRGAVKRVSDRKTEFAHRFFAAAQAAGFATPADRNQGRGEFQWLALPLAHGDEVVLGAAAILPRVRIEFVNRRLELEFASGADRIDVDGLNWALRGASVPYLVRAGKKSWFVGGGMPAIDLAVAFDEQADVVAQLFNEVTDLVRWWRTSGRELVEAAAIGRRPAS